MNTRTKFVFYLLNISLLFVTPSFAYKSVYLYGRFLGPKIDENLPNGPCDNFYKFSCQLWNEQNPRPEWTEVWNVLSVVRKKSNKLVLGLYVSAFIDYLQ